MLKEGQTGSADREACRELVQEIAASRAFRRSARQRDLFVYLCGLALDEPGAEVTEQKVGVEVFGRAADYDTGNDTIVRVHASELRKRLKTYFETEGAASEVVVEIPKGGYLPVFTPRQPAVSGEAHAAPSWQRPAAVVGLVLLAATAAWLVRGMWDARALRGELLRSLELSRLWSQFDRADQRTYVVAADSIHGLMQDLRKKTAPLAEYTRREYWQGEGKDPLVRMMMNREYTGLADLGLARKLGAGFGADQGRLQFIFARHFQLRWLNTDNAILIGSRRSNPWVEVFEPMLNFQFEYDEASGRTLVRNRAPKAGEQATYAASIASDEIKQGYALIAYLPNLRRTGSVLLLSGTSTAETDVAGYYLTSEEPFARLLEQLGVRPGEPLPYFEVLLKTLRVGLETRKQEFVAARLPRL